ncbi:type VII secretion system-associated protein [Amycolatopsis mongoliensis]|uniref:Type VII secretion system-associated protein n=1 Tax=Amycolatopsis mongoliensis TaxID=715475 RepID=A0A9Y2JGS0_9PSEU|nr:type VII secretion system-associated protein [Amycolatopsis sp. 4-36]WIX98204.1 type VII secretion system-associated protein [Amycolatopsis sp. 4-36]
MIGVPEAGEAAGNRLLLLLDPAFVPGDDQPDVPAHAILGAWLADEAGKPSRFHPNPAYRPSAPDSPLDPVDAVLRALADGKDIADQLSIVLRDTVLGIATEKDGTAVVRPAPDGVPSVQVTTAYGHRAGVGEEVHWLNVTVEELAEALPPQGVDVLLNPGSPASMRVLAETIRAVANDAGEA